MTTQVLTPLLTRSRGALRRFDRTANYATAVLLAVLLPLLTLHQMPQWFEQHTFLNLSVGVSLAVAAVSLNVLLGYTGQLSLGHAALLAAGAFASGIAVSRWGLPMGVGMIFAVVVSAAVAFLIGLPALRLRGQNLSIVTLVFGFAMQYSVLRANFLSKGSAGVALPRRVLGSHFTTDQAIYLVVVLVILVAVWAIDVNITGSRLGRAFRTIRENEAIAQAFGINVTRYKLLAFTVSGGLAGLAGAMYGHAIGFVNSEAPFNYLLSLLLVVIVVVGGLGRRLPVLVAALFYALLPSFIHGLRQWAPVVGAVLLIATVTLHPEGIGDLLAGPRRPRLSDGDEDNDDELPALPQLPVPQRELARDTSAGEPMLEVHDVVVRFGGLQAVDHASLCVPAGQIVGLIGPNGAGKSTLFNAVSGLVRVQGGRIRYRGQEIQQLRSDQRARLGIARSFQQVGLAKDLSVRENLLLAQHQLARYGDVEALLMLPRTARDERSFGARADATIEALGFAAMAEMPLRNLSGGQQRIVEIAALLMTAPDLVMLDEPSAGMAPAAAENLAQRLRDLRDALGRTVLLIEHNVPMVLDCCDYVYVLDAGRVIAEGEPRDVVANQDVITAYLGAPVGAMA